LTDSVFSGNLWVRKKKTMPVTIYTRQKQILEYIAQYIQKNHFSPTLKEIARMLKVNSLATVHEHLEVLEKKGLVKRYRGSVRGIRLLKVNINQLGSVELPLLGYIAAGKPIEPYTDPEASISAPPNMFSGKNRAYVLQVKGDSMIEEGILDGDFVVVEEQETAADGDTVVALLENGFATLKKFYRESTRVRLEPANKAMRPIFARNVRIQGKVVGVIRRF